MKLTLGHSPDADDAFMFYAMAKNLVNLRGHEFAHILQDIETLNLRCQAQELDISAVSFHAYTTIADSYALLPCGASFGDGYGPCLVAKRKIDRATMKKVRIGVPGLLTLLSNFTWDFPTDLFRRSIFLSIKFRRKFFREELMLELSFMRDN
jgi:1,4-dihydroxy-6-naphthoate synthase